MPKLESLKIVVRGKHDTGKTTVANLIKVFLEDNGFRQVSIEDVPPLPLEQKAEFVSRFKRNQDLRPVRIVVELEED
jgi:Flp pilus assembly CpaF family ATPase